MNRRISYFAGAFLLLGIVFVGAETGSAMNLSFSSVDLDLDDPSTGNNSFETIFRFSDPGTGISIDGGPITVDYEDENMTGMQVNLDIDFSDLNAPVVNTVEFVGEPGDISHVFPGGAIELLFNNGVIDVDLDAVPNGIKGFLRTQGGPIMVNNNGSFGGGNTNLVARQGTVDIDGSITTLIAALTVDETFNLADTPLNEFNDAISGGVTNNVSVNFVGIDAGERVYNVSVTADLVNTQLPFATTDFDLILDITGTFQGSGEIRIDAVPEPGTVGLLIAALAFTTASGRRTRGLCYC